MAGMQGALIGGVMPFTLGWGVVVSDIVAAGSALASITFNTDGSNTLVGNSSTGSTKVARQAPYASMASFYIQLTGTGAAPASGSTGVWQQMNVARLWSWTQGPGAGVKTFDGTFSIASDAGGVNVLWTGSISVDVER
ncbi:hypothetical protein [Bacteriophage sp.]|nr:hypothetical protein [Bacteriophage sp.]